MSKSSESAKIHARKRLDYILIFDCVCVVADNSAGFVTKLDCMISETFVGFITSSI